MPKDGKEPQSYGSQEDWVTGRTGEQVNEQKSEPAPEHREFYDERRESETTGEDQGGKTSDFQLAENAQARSGPTDDETAGSKNVTTQTGGAKRDGYFKRRDYE
jgi:hypothetical protein